MGRSLQCWIYGFSIFHQDFLCVCKPGGTPTPRPGLTVHVGGPEGPDGGRTLPACSQHLHLQAVEGAGPQTRDQELGVILGKGGKVLGDTGPSGAASDHDPRLDSPPETTPPHYVTVLETTPPRDVTVLRAGVVRLLPLHHVQGPTICPRSLETPPPPVVWPARRPWLLAAKSSHESGPFLRLTPTLSRGLHFPFLNLRLSQALKVFICTSCDVNS